MTKTFNKILLAAVTALLIVSCDKKDDGLDSYSFGESYYVPGFLWINPEQVFIEKTIVLDFNDESKYNKSTASFGFIGTDGKPLNLKEHIVYIDDQRLESPQFTVSADQDSVKLRMSCVPGAKEGAKAGRLVLLSGHTLDRIDDTILDSPSTTADICKWEYQYSEKANPLLLGIYWFLAIAFTLFIIWIVILRGIIFHKFKVEFTITTPHFAEPLSGVREVRFSNKEEKGQGWFSKLFTYRVIKQCNQFWPSPFIITPESDGISIDYDSKDYDGPRIITLSGKSSVSKSFTNKRNKTKFTINVME